MSSSKEALDQHNIFHQELVGIIYPLVILAPDIASSVNPKTSSTSNSLIA